MICARTSDVEGFCCPVFSCRLWVFLLHVVYLLGGSVFPGLQTFPFHL